MAVTGERMLTRLGFEVDEISLKSSMEKVAAFASALRDAADAAFAGLTKIARGEAEAAAQAGALGVSVDRFAEWKFIAEQMGASVEALEASLKAMLANNPGIADAASELERAGGAMRDMGDAQREAYALDLGIDPSLIPMLTQDVSGLRDMFRSLYATAGTDARQAAEDSEGFLSGVARLAGLCELLAKAVGLSLMGTARRGVEELNAAFAAHFDDIRRVLEVVIALVSAAGPVIGAVIGQIAFWGGQLAGLLGMLDADLVAGIGKGIAAFITLRGVVGAAIIGFANLKEVWGIVTAALSANPWMLAIGGLVTLAVLVIENWGAVKGFFTGVWDAVASGVRAAAGAVASAFGGALDVVSGLLSGLGVAAGAALDGFVNGLRLIGDLISAVFSGDLSGALDAGSGLFTNFRETAVGVFSSLGEAALGVFSSLWGKIAGTFPGFGAWASDAAESVGAAFSGAVDALAPLASGALGAVSSAVSGAAGVLGPVFSSTLDAVMPAASGAVGALSSALGGAVAFVSERFPSLGTAAEAVGRGIAGHFQGIRDLVGSVFSGDLSGALDAGIGLFSNFRDTASGVFAAFGEGILGVFASLWGQVAAAFPDFGAWAAGAASAIVGTFGKALGWVREKLHGLIGMLPDWVLEQLGWKSEPGAGAEGGDMPEFGVQDARGGQGAGAGYGGFSGAGTAGAGTAGVGGFDGASGAYPSGAYPSGAYPSGGSASGVAGSFGEAARRVTGGGSPGLFGASFKTQPFFSPSTDAYLMASPWQSAAMASNSHAVSLESKTEINVSGAGSPQEVARRVAAEQDNLNADLIRYAQGAVR